MPNPSAAHLTCDTCGLPWGDHADDGDGVSMSECVRLLRIALDRARIAYINATLQTSYPVVMPAPGAIPLPPLPSLPSPDQ